MEHPRQKRMRAIVGLLAASLLLPVSALATPSGRGDIDDSRARERTAQDQISSLEAEIVALAQAAERTEIAAGIAGEKLVVAQDNLLQAQAEAEATGRALQSSATKLEEARLLLGNVARNVYQGASSSVGQLSPFLAADLNSVLKSSTYLRQLGGQTQATVSQYESLRAEHKALEQRASAAVKLREEAAGTVAQAAEEAQKRADEQAKALERSRTQREVLITRLAEQRRTTVALERAHQDEQERKRQQAREERDRRAAENAPKPTPAPRPAPAPQPAPKPTPAPQPAPKPTPAPQPGPAPKPNPVPQPAPGVEGAIKWALSKVGYPYVFGANGPHAYDCSSLTQHAFAQAGYRLRRSASQQYSTAGAYVPLSQLKRGDLVFWSSNGQASGVYHVAIYLGDGMKVHARSPGYGVVHDKMYYANIMPYAVRVG